MAFDGGANTFIFLAGCFLFTAHGMKVARDLLSPEWRGRASETFGKLTRLLRSKFRRRTAVGELEEEVAGRLLDWQLSQFRSALKVLLLISAMPILLVAFIKVVLGVDGLQSPAQDGLLVSWYAALLLADWCPWLVTKRNLDAWYSGLMAILGLFMLPFICPSNHLLEAVSVAKMLGALLSLARMNLSAVVLWSAVHMACEYWTHAASGQSMAMNLWLVWPFMLSMLIGKLEVHLEAELHKDIKARVMQDRQSASDALSAMFYDVVVELDHNRCIAAPTTKLAAFLLRSAPTQLEGTLLEDLLQDEQDRARLRSLLCPADDPAASSFVELAHARVRGSTGTVFEVELFGYRFLGPGGRQRYLVGIRDASDFDTGGVRVAHAGPQPVAMAPLDEVAIEIDPYEDKFPILSHTRGFSSRIMSVAEGGCLLPSVAKESKFASWVQTSVNWHIATLRDDRVKLRKPPESFPVTFRPHGRNSPLRTLAVCKLEVEERDPTDGESQGGQFTVKLRFSSIVQGPRGAERTSRRGDSTSSSSSSASSRGGTPSFSLRMSLEDRPASPGARMSL